jgi:hypothetical protein
MTLNKATRTGIVITLLLLVWTVDTHSQTTAQDRANTLRLQLEEVKTKQLDLQSRLQSLEEQAKPENIEKSLAGIGSTKPEDLRELKRRQLESEKASIQKQLTLLGESRTRLESGIAQADADAYQQSAKGPATSVTSNQSVTAQKENQIQRPRRVKKKKSVRTRGTAVSNS